MNVTLANIKKQDRNMINKILITFLSNNSQYIYIFLLFSLPFLKVIDNRYLNSCHVMA